MYLLTYLAVTTYYRSWPQLNYDAIHHELSQLGANFGYPALLLSLSPGQPNAFKAVLFCDFHHLAQMRRLYELSWSYPYERHEPAIEDVVFSLHRCYRIIVQLLLPIVCGILLYRRKVQKSYVGFSSRTGLMVAHLKMSLCRSLQHIIRPAI